MFLIVLDVLVITWMPNSKNDLSVMFNAEFVGKSTYRIQF